MPRPSRATAVGHIALSGYVQVTGCPACLEPGDGFTPPHVHGVVHGRRFRFCYCTRRICACRLDCHTDKRPGCIEAVGMVRYQQFSAVIVILCEELRYAHIIRALPGTWSHRPDLNGQPADYKTAALPVELQWHCMQPGAAAPSPPPHSHTWRGWKRRRHRRFLLYAPIFSHIICPKVSLTKIFLVFLPLSLSAGAYIGSRYFLMVPCHPSFAVYAGN